MITRDLNDLDRRIAEVRQQIKEQKAIIHGFEQAADVADATQAGVALRVLEDELSRLLQRRVTILGRFRRRRAASKPGSPGRPSKSTA